MVCVAVRGRAPADAGYCARAEGARPGVPHGSDRRVRFPPNGPGWRVRCAARRSRAGEIAHGTEHAEDGCSRGRLQSFTKVAEKSHRSGPEQLVESGKVVRLGCHISFLEQSVLLLL